jgi:hypothetical protein
MNRTSNKARKIAWSILGKPANMVYKKTRSQKELDRRLEKEKYYKT